eukprot:TRINITY_DN2224_c0_g1_i1.p1 TRINITY_DN2224_c0_g1~~TRINITY_DN2224_c0_g1_i1.p1  ORF type:complete len:393 (+),score=82.76 TRINITY_DN2224_c0_g1_i1:1-1179(+)
MTTTTTLLNDERQMSTDTTSTPLPLSVEVGSGPASRKKRTKGNKHSDNDNDNDSYDDDRADEQMGEEAEEDAAASFLNFLQNGKKRGKGQGSKRKEERVERRERRKSKLRKKSDDFSDERFLPSVAESGVELKGKLGTGTFGAVYRGKFNNQDVAVKKVRTADESLLNETEYSRFIQEGKLMLSLEPHENLIHIYAIVYDRESPAIIMMLAPNGTLHEYWTDLDTLPPDTLFKFVGGTAKGLHYLHKHRIIHRDVAARNILLQDDLTPMLSDFGLSREVEDGDEMYNSTGQVGLPLKWMAPEALKHGRFSQMTDMWSFGVAVWEMATCGNEPFPDIDSVEAIIRIRDDFETPPLPKDLNETLKVVITQCWFRDPDMRPSARDVLDILRERDI